MQHTLYRDDGSLCLTRVDPMAASLQRRSAEPGFAHIAVTASLLEEECGSILRSVGVLSRSGDKSGSHSSRVHSVIRLTLCAHASLILY